MSSFCAALSGVPVPLRRIGRRLFWSEPGRYRWLGILRGRGDCLQNDYDVWLGGYPRSANTFAAAAFRLANPEARVASHFHIPTFAIHGLQMGKPGILLVRPPLDAAVSWTIFWGGSIGLEDALDYYVDFHRALIGYKAELFVATFAETTRDFGRVLLRFNCRFGTNYTSLSANENSVKRCLAYVDECARSENGSINEFTVSRPSEKRSKIKVQLIKELHSSPKLVGKLVAANEVYEAFKLLARDVPSFLQHNSSENSVQEQMRAISRI